MKTTQRATVAKKQFDPVVCGSSPVADNAPVTRTNYGSSLAPVGGAMGASTFSNAPVRESATGALSRKSRESALSLKRNIERARRLHRICGCIARRMERGQTQHKALTWFAWFYRNRFYKCDPSKKLRFKYKTLMGAYYQWKRGGRSPEALTLRYANSRPKIRSAHLRRFIASCLRPDCRYFTAAHRNLSAPVATSCAYYRALSPRLRKAFRNLFRHRHHVTHALRMVRVIQKASQ